MPEIQQDPLDLFLDYYVTYPIWWEGRDLNNLNTVEEKNAKRAEIAKDVNTIKGMITKIAQELTEQNRALLVRLQASRTDQGAVKGILPSTEMDPESVNESAHQDSLRKQMSDADNRAAMTQRELSVLKLVMKNFLMLVNSHRPLDQFKDILNNDAAFQAALSDAPAAEPLDPFDDPDYNPGPGGNPQPK